MGREFVITDELAQLFEDEVNYWVDQFQLRDWSIRCEVEDIGDTIGATTYAKFAGKLAVFHINKYWDFPHTAEVVARNAFHEACELLLWEMEEDCTSGVEVSDAQRTSINAARHGVIRRLEWAVFRPYWAQRQKEDEDERELPKKPKGKSVSTH